MNETLCNDATTSFAEPVRMARVLSRRTALSISLIGLVSGITGCGGGGSEPGITPIASEGPAPAPAPAPAPGLTWNIGSLYFAVGSDAVVDLSTTLPTGVALGGTFGLSPMGKALPTGMSLTSNGILAIGNATVGEVTGVVFTYATPGS